MSLMYNPRNERLMTRSDMAGLVIPPALGPTHKPISFSDFADQVVNAVKAKDFEIVKEEYAVNKENTRMFGLMTVAPANGAIEGDYISAKDWEMQIGLRGSHDRKLPRGITLGSNVLVCSNLCFHGELANLKTKQTTNVEERLPLIIENAIEQLPSMIAHNNKRFDLYRTTKFDKRDGDAALIELYRQGALSARQLPRAITEWDVPSFDAHGEDGYNVWRLFNASTEALKPQGGEVGNMDTLRRSSQRLTQVMDGLVNLH